MQAPHLEADVSLPTLKRLLDLGAEGPRLDYKRWMNLAQPSEVVELAKDVGAMLDLGGHLIVGADSQGRPCGGLTPEEANLFDEAKLRSKLRKYVPEPFRLFTAVHEHAGLILAIVHILPHPAGCCVFAQKGEYVRDGRTVLAFRQAEIFVRHGSASERAAQHDIARILDKRCIIAESSEVASQLARDAARRAFLAGQTLGQCNPAYLSGAVGFAMTRRALNVNDRIFYQHEYRNTLDNVLERKFLRREGHMFHPEHGWQSHSYSVWGKLTHSRERDSFVLVRTDSQGGVGVYFQEDVTKWTVEELVAWWFAGAWFLGTMLQGLLGSSGELYTCNLLTDDVEVNAEPIELPPIIQATHPDGLYSMMAEQMTSLRNQAMSKTNFWRPTRDEWSPWDLRDRLNSGRRSR